MILDALDEGRLLSNDNGFISFLETAAELILDGNRETSGPKLVMFGRSDATALAELIFDDKGVARTTLQIEYFDKEAATQLIHTYAVKAAEKDCAYLKHREPANQYVSAYFDKIESALGLVDGTLWQDERGKAFAGYAPVLAAIGSLLPKIDNFQEAMNDLASSGVRDAWGVIEFVLGEIMIRERPKIANPLKGHLSTALPAEAYNPEEQLSLLLQFVQRNPLRGSGRLALGAHDNSKYFEMVQRWLPEHPFLRDYNFTNDVFAAFVYSYAILNGIALEGFSAALGGQSRLPFLWRSLAGKLTPDTLIDGNLLGYILGSFWSDPLTERDRVVVRTDAGDDAVMVTVSSQGYEDISFVCTSPIMLLGQARNISVNITGEIRLDGAGDVRASVFSFYGDVEISAANVRINANVAKVTGDLWLNGSVSTVNQISLDVEKESNVGWGPSVGEQYPFSRFVSSLPDPFLTTQRSVLAQIVDECMRRFTTATLTLNADFSPPTNDVYTQWASVRYAQTFPAFINLLVQHGLAVSQPMAASGTQKIRVRFSVNWRELAEAVANEHLHAHLQTFVRAARTLIG